ncbi:helix-turn-helix transcriptional regulator [Microbacterium sp. NPDC057944]|uniref:helix-turn-helix transcriptional regulator n=1 Tax=Microbacterium sp. NPDC057944 TaxID=3346286 RepID=UPI0036D8060D
MSRHTRSKRWEIYRDEHGTGWTLRSKADGTRNPAEERILGSKDKQVRKILTIQEVSTITGLAVQTLYNLRSTGGDAPRSFTLRGRVRYFEDDLEAWVTTAHSAHR